MKYLMRCLKQYRPEAVLAPLFKLFEAAMELLVPLVVAQIVDVGIANGDKPYILHACLLLVAFGALGLGFALTAQYFAARAAVGCSAELRGALFDKMTAFSFTEIDGVGVPTMLTRLTSDCQQVQSGVNMFLRIVLRSPIVVFGATAMAFFVDAKTALVFVALIPLLALAVFGVMAACVPRYRAVQNKLDGVYGATRENLTGARVIRAFRKEEDERASFREKSASLARAQERVGMVASLTGSFTFILVNLAVVVLLYTGAIRVDAGALGQGDVMALYGYLSLILVELIKFANLIITVAKAAGCMRRIAAVLDMESERETGEAVPQGGTAVSFQNVSFTYADGGAPALQGVDFSVGRGETVGILGGTGAGKSTLVRLIPRFYEATEGTVCVGDADVDSLSASALRKTVGYVPQKISLFRGTIAENLRWGNENATDEELLAAAEAAQALDVLESKGGLDGEVAQEGRNLSGGQRQRLSIARALVRKPEILILDDASSALDYATEARLRAALRGLGCAVFLVSQRVASVMHADKIVVLDDGKVAAIGTHAELLEHSPLYREIYASQTEESL